MLLYCLIVGIGQDLNPEDRNKWDIVDSCVSLYEDAGAHVFEVNTLNQLAQFVEQM